MHHFLPIAVAHVVIQNLGAVGQRGRSGRRGDGVEDRPKRFKHFAVNDTCTWNVVCCPSV